MLAFMPERDESDQLPEEGQGGEVPDDDGQGGSREDAKDQAGGADKDGDEGEGQATGNPRSAG